MAIENTSSPVAQPGTQMRTVSSAPRFSKILGMTAARERFERFVVAEEVCHVDQQIPKQGTDFLGLLPQHLKISVNGSELSDMHAPLHSAHEGLRLIAAEIVANLVAQKTVDLGEAPIGGGSLASGDGDIGKLIEQIYALDEFGQLTAHFLDRNGEIDEAGGDRGIRHIGMPGTEAVSDLGEGDAAAFLDRFDPERAVGITSRKNDAAGKIADVDCQRTQEDVDGLALAPMVVRAKNQSAVLNLKAGVSGHDVDAVDFDRHPFRRDMDRKSGVVAYDLMQQAFPIGTEMGDNDERQPGLGGHASKQSLQGLNAAGRGADTDNGKNGRVRHRGMPHKASRRSAGRSATKTIPHPRRAIMTP
ncbi:MAG TPA: hypothetical protein VL752_16150 [Acidisoma sp.]|nr:hypothetical protein [Acidisoma sp.]HTI02483.1 hypothetical protein [Acidisoma sp.]